MASFLFAFVAVALVSLGSRDQLLIARLAEALGRGAGLLAAGLLAALLSAAGMAWGGDAISHLLPADAQAMLVSIALLLAAAELAWPNRERPPAEPTRSFAAVAIVLLARQLGDGARFLVFALAAATASPLLAGAGGALGGAAAVTLGWSLGGELERRVPLRAIRLGLSAVIAIVAVGIGLNARGIIG
ncbi:MAG: TMEM165/GDT1 family protein [Tsuneonella sp.]